MSDEQRKAENKAILNLLCELAQDLPGTLFKLSAGVNMLLEERNYYRAALEEIAKEPGTPHGWAASEALRWKPPPPAGG